MKKRVCCCALLAFAVLTLPASGMTAASSLLFMTKGFRCAKLMSRTKEGDYCVRLYREVASRYDVGVSISKGAV